MQYKAHESNNVVARKMFSAAISTRLTASHPNSEVKLVRAGVVLRWGTTREGPVLRFCLFCCLFGNTFSLLFLGGVLPP